MFFDMFISNDKMSLSMYYIIFFWGYIVYLMIVFFGIIFMFIIKVVFFLFKDIMYLL